MSSVLGAMRQKRWAVTLYDGSARPARLKKVKVLAGDGGAAKEVALSFYPGFEVVAAVELPGMREVVL